MKSQSLSLLLPCVIVSCFFLSKSLAANLHEDSKFPSIEMLIQAMGDPNDEKRRHATMTLLSRKDAIPQLRESCKSDNPAIAKESAKILHVLETVVCKEYLARGKQYADQGRIDIHTEFQLLAPITSETFDSYWQHSIDVGRSVVAKARMPFDEANRSTKQPKQVLELGIPDQASRIQYFLPRGSEIFSQFSTFQGGSFRHGLVRANDVAVRTPSQFICITRHFAGNAEGAFIFVNGTAKCKTTLQVLVIADGDVEVPLAMHSVIIARGMIHGLKADPSILISGSKVINKDTILKPHVLGGTSVVIENAVKPLNWITWFETKELGIEAKLGDDGVAISNIAKGSMFDKASCKVGDVVLTCFDERVRTVVAFRDGIRKGIVVGEVPMVVQRGKEKVKLSVSLADADSILLPQKENKKP